MKKDILRRKENIEKDGFDTFITAELKKQYPDYKINVEHNKDEFEYWSQRKGSSWDSISPGYVGIYSNRFFFLDKEGKVIPELSPKISQAERVFSDDSLDWVEREEQKRWTEEKIDKAYAVVEIGKRVDEFYDQDGQLQKEISGRVADRWIYVICRN